MGGVSATCASRRTREPGCCGAAYPLEVSAEGPSPKGPWLGDAPLGPPYDVLRRQAEETGAIDDEPWTWEHAPTTPVGRSLRVFAAQFRRRRRHRASAEREKRARDDRERE